MAHALRIFCVLSVLVACLTAAAEQPTPAPAPADPAGAAAVAATDQRIVNILGGPSATATVLLADRVVITRFEQPMDGGAEKTLTGPVALPVTQAAALVRLLGAPASYLRPELGEGSGKACKPTPGVRLSFERSAGAQGPATSVSVEVCFACKMLGVKSADGAWISLGDCDPGVPALSAIVKAAFPGHPSVEALP